ncbi:MAG: hypothetical protein IPP63_01945 [Chloracidobacterium sp.]|nr:hypothetical protein [Chloracidobacterium sp.]
MQNLRELKTELLKEIGVRVKDLGFTLNVGRQGFYRKTSFGKQSFHLSFIPHSSDMDVTADVAIRFDALEDLVHEHIPGLFFNPTLARNTFSFGSNLGHIIGEGQVRWTIADIGDVQTVATKMVETFLTVGMPYLERYSDLHLAFRVISTVNPEANLLTGFPDKQATNAIGLAFLLGKEDEFHEIVNEMTNYLVPIPNSNIEVFLEFANKLEQRFGNKTA